MTDIITRKVADLGPIHALLLRACPPCRRNPESGAYEIHREKDSGEPVFRSTHILADLLGISSWGVHLWIKRGRIPYARVKEIVALGEVDFDDFSPYIS